MACSGGCRGKVAESVVVVGFWGGAWVEKAVRVVLRGGDVAESVVRVVLWVCVWVEKAVRVREEGGDRAESSSWRAIPATEPQEVGQGAGGLRPSHKFSRFLKTYHLGFTLVATPSCLHCDLAYYKFSFRFHLSMYSPLSHLTYCAHIFINSFKTHAL